MGAHHAPHSSSSHAARLAGRGALTAAAALALTGGTASLAFASEAPSVPTTQAITGHATDGAHELQSAAKASPLSDASHVSAHSLTSSVSSHGTDLQDKASAATSALQGKAPSSLPTKPPTSLPVSDMKADTAAGATNTVNDIQHAATNWSAAAKGGLTPAEGATQAKLVAQDVNHAVANGQKDVASWSSSLTGHAPELPGKSVLSFG
ncbi:hypothetical protein LQ327_27005 [Actinomycetospora endophytica]|uniref:Uncharacterized protein n=1 Tax=Actinomycetospora endophytica TaxID=2291215 RepID=A0ABS8PFK5_9PSEU|nr:hypothetical protein [Actinomycetospora endophytica]MCD2197026.1 hypothetical protein [Actinomycetospora endophytica]